MTKLRIIAENYLDTATLDAVPTLADNTEVSNIQTVSRSKIIRTDNLGAPQSITAILAPARTISAVVIGRHNFPEGMILQIYLYDDLTFSSLVYNSGALTVTEEEASTTNLAWDAFLWDSTAADISDMEEDVASSANYVHWINTEVGPLEETTTVIALEETSTGNILLETDSIEEIGVDNVQGIKIVIEIPATQNIEIGRLIVGDYIEPTYNMDYGHKLTWNESSKQYRTEGATLRSDISIPNRKLEFSLNTINEEDRTLLQNGLRYVGLRKDFYINMFPENSNTELEADYSGIVKLTKEPSMSEYAPLYYKSKYIMEEV